MLTQRVFGSAPIPEWATDHEKFTAWATTPIGRPAFSKRIDLKKIGEKRSKIGDEQQLIDHVLERWEKICTGDILAWDYADKDHFSFGWGGVRFSFHRLPSGAFTLSIFKWFLFDGWAPMDYYEKSSAISLISTILKSRNQYNHQVIFNANTHSSNSSPFHSAMWDERNFYPIGEYFVSLKNEELTPDCVQHTVKEEHTRDFYVWLRHRLRHAAFRFPELRLIFAAIRLWNKTEQFPIDQAINSLSKDPNWKSSPLDWLVFSQYDLLSSPFSSFSDYNFQQLPHENPEKISAVFNINHKNQLDSFTPFIKQHKKFYKQLNTLQSYRLITFAWECNQCFINTLTRVLSLENAPVPSLRRMELISKNYTCMMAFFGNIPKWVEGNKPWPFPSVVIPYRKKDNNLKHWLGILSEIKKIHVEKPELFQALARSAHALVKAPLRRDGMSVEETHASDCEVLSQLSSDTLAPHLDWSRLPPKAPWAAYLTLLKHARQVVMENTTDFHDEFSPLALELDEDAAWQSALGIFTLDGIRVFPLCRPSHLAVIGEFFKNCVSKDRSLQTYVDRARSNTNTARYFRLEHGHHQALLFISYYEDAQKWKIAELRGRFNQEPSENFMAAAERIVELYTTLVPRSSDH